MTPSASGETPPTAYERIAGELRERILSGALTAGDRLPSEAKLCTVFGASRSTVREALRQLSSHGLIRTRPGARGGSVVAQPRPEAILEYLRTSLTLIAGTADMTVEELLEVRELLEVPAARMAALRRDDAGLALLRELAADDGATREELFRRNRDFHQRILLLGGNRLHHLMTEPVFRLLSQRARGEPRAAPFWAEIRAEHLAIVDAIDRGEGDAAASAMRDHLRRLEPFYLPTEGAAPDSPTAGRG